MQFLVELLVDIESCELLGWVIVRIVVVSCEKVEYNKTGDFILDLYWSGCRGDWPSALHVTSKLVIGSTY